MKRENFLNYSFFKDIQDFGTHGHVESYPEPDLSVSRFDEILKEIFTVDENSGFPVGDITYYMSEHGNPVVKSWLEKYLLSPRNITVDNNPNIDDDLRVEFSRRQGESVSDYAVRLRGYYDEATYLINSENSD